MQIKEQRQHRKLVFQMMAILTFTQIVVALVPRSLAPLGPFLEQDLGLEKVHIGLLTAALFLGQSFSSLPVGYWADRLGSRIWILLLCLCIGLSFAIVSISHYFWVIVICVIFGGVGYGGFVPASNRSIVYWVPIKNRGIAMGTKQMGVSIGSSLAALIIIPLSVNLGWRTALFSASVFLIIVGVISFYYYRDPEQVKDSKEKVMFNETFKKLLNNKKLIILTVSAMGLIGGQMSVYSYLVFYTHEKLHFSLLLAGISLVFYEIGSTVGRIAWGMLSDRLFYKNRIVIMELVAIITAICSMVLAFLTPNILFIFVILIVFIMGYSVGGFHGIWMNIAAEAVNEEESGIATGFSLSFGSWGVIIIPPLFGWIIDYSSYTLAWILLSITMMIVFMVLKIGQRNFKV
jgi:MFS transporter, ACS family, hexuronate transporter